MDPTCGLAEKFRDIVLDRIWEQLHYLVCYGQNIEQLHERLEELTLERSSIQHRIDEATNNAEQIEEKVLQWLLKVDEISEQVQKLHEKSQAKRECSITSCPNLWLRYKLSKRATETAQQVAEICKKVNFDRVSYRVPPQSMPQLTNRESNEGIDSRVLIMNEIMESLQNPSVNMIGLCGLGGVGKTTIAKEVEKNQKMFEKVVMATVSEELNVEKIQGQISEKLGMQLNERTEQLRAYRLCHRLEQEKNMLLILDDLWEELDLDRVGIPFAHVENNSKKNEGCKILLTSRKDTLLSNIMKCQKLVKVGVLSDNEASDLFKKIAELPINSSSSDLMPIATEIVRKCGGLPLAIATAAKALRGKDLNEWKDYRARLNNPLRRNITGIREVDTILKVSVDLLSSENKDIFLLTGMLSHDPLIEQLLVYAVGLDILKGVDNMKEAQEGIFAIVNKLKSFNLFLDSFSSDRVTIHDVVRDVALSIAFNELHAFVRRRLKEWPDEDILEESKVICLQESGISSLPEELHGPRLEFFLLNSEKHYLTIPSMFFKSSKELKVLELTKVQFLSLQSLRCLQKLKVLCLHSCLLKDISGVRSLKKLKVLSLAYSNIQQLPIELIELTSLQMLNLSHCSQLTVIPPKILCSLKKLEVLSMGNSFYQWKVEGSSKADENVSLVELKGLPIYCLDIHIPNITMLPEDLFLHMNLESYKIFIGQLWGWWRVNFETSKTLKLELGSIIHLKRGIRKLLGEVEDLCLYGSNRHENVLYSHDGRGFPRLKRLQIERNDDIKYIVLNSTHHEAAFPILESLILKNLKALEKLSQGPNDVVFPQLHTLRMHNLPALTADQCIKDRATNNVSNEVFKSLFNSKVLLPKIEILELSNLNHLIPLIWDEQLSNNSFSNLKILMVESCGFVKLVPFHVLKSLNNLEELKVKKCDKLEMVFDFEDLNDYKAMESSSVVVPLKRLELWDLPKLKNVCHRIVAKDEVSEFVDAAFEFPRLTSLELNKLPNLRNFYPQRHTLKLPHLQQLSIQDCDKLEIFKKKISSSSEIHEEDSTLNSKYPLLSYKVIHPKLQLLHLSIQKRTTISYASLLRSFPNLEILELKGDFEETFGGDDIAALAPLLSTFTLRNISNMISLAPSLVSSPNLTHLKVRDCDRLTILMTSSVARCLVHLTHLSISFCCQIEEIIIKQKGEDDYDKEIIFGKLKFLELYELPRLKIFCGHNYTFKFPFLDTLSITRCLEFKTFSTGTIDTPSLKSVELSDREIWDTDLNKTFYKERFMASRVLVLGEYDAIKMRNTDQFPADPCPKVEILLVERIVDEGLTIPYALLERFPNLKALQVTSSQLTTLMTSSAARCLVYLTSLSVSYCNKIKQIITKQEGEDDDDQEIVFSELGFLKLDGLPRLERFCSHNYTFKFPLLKSVSIRECHRLTMFCLGAIHAPLLKSVHGTYNKIWKNDLNTTIQHQFALEERISQ